MASKSDIRAGRAFIELFVKGAQLEAGLKKASSQLQQFATSAKQLGQSLVAFATPAAIGIGLATKRFADFDDQMRAAGASVEATEQQLASMTATAEQLGASTSFTAVQVGSLMTELGRAGFNPDQINAMTGAVLDLARASGTDATVASGIMAATIRQFGLAAEDAGRVADVLTAAANKSFTSVEQLGEALNYAGPVAHDFNMSLEDTLAIFGGLGNMGIQASNAGTAVRRLLTLTASEADTMKEIFGVTFKDAAGNARPLIDVLEEVNEATKGMPTAERAEKFNEAFGLLGITAASAIGATVGSIRELKRELDTATGTSRKTAQQMDAGLGGSFRILLSAVEAVAIKIGRALSPAIKTLADMLTGVATRLVKWIEANQELVVAITAGVAVVGAFGVGLLALGTAASVAGIALGGLATIAGFVVSAAAAMVTPIGAVVTAIVAMNAAAIGIAAAFVYASGIIPQLTEALKPLAAAISEISMALLDGDFSKAWDVIATSIKYVGSLAMDVFDQIPKFAGYAAGRITKAFVDAFSATWTWILESQKDVLTGMLTAAAKFAPQILRAMFTGDFVGAAANIAISMRDVLKDVQEGAKAFGEGYVGLPAPELVTSKRTDDLLERMKATFRKKKPDATNNPLVDDDPFSEAPAEKSSATAPTGTVSWMAEPKESPDLDGSAVKSYADQIGELSDLLWNGKISLDEYDKRLKAIKDDLVGVSPIEQYTRKIEELTQALKDGTITADEFEKGKADAKSTAFGIDSTPIEKYKERLKDLDAAFAAGAITKDEYLAARDEAKTDLFDPSPIEKYHAKVKDLKALFDAGLISEDEFKTAQMEALPGNVKRIIEQAKSPLQKFNEQITEARNLFDAGLINKDQFAVEQERLQAELRKDSGETKRKERVSVSFSAAALIAQGRGGGGGKADQIPSKLDLQLIELRRQNDLLRKIEAKDIGAKVR